MLVDTDSMRLIRLPLKLAILIGLTTIGTAFFAENTQAQTLVTRKVPTVVFRELPTTAKLLKTNQRSLPHQNMQLMAMPQSHLYILAQVNKQGGNGIIWIILFGGVAIAGISIVIQKGVIVIAKDEVGIVYKKFAPFRGSLPGNKLIALNGEAGYQAKTLSSGLHLWRWPWIYHIRKETIIDIPHGEIGLVIARDGQKIPRERILGRVVDECEDFQDGHGFLKNGGQKGKQMALLTAGSYRINTELFTVITTANASKHGMKPEQLKVYEVEPNKVGIVTVYDGKPIEAGEIAGPVIHDNNNFLDGEKFINGGGQKGLQEEVLPAGSWNLNPWFVNVEQVALTEIPHGYVGVIKSDVGKTLEKITATASYQGDFVEDGYKGICKNPLRPGKYAINTWVKKIEQIPTDNIVLKWSNQSHSNYYYKHLPALKVHDKNGFAFDVEITQVIRVNPEDAPKMLASIGSIDEMIEEVLKPTVSHYFLNAAQDYEALEFLNNRTDLQESAKQHIKVALNTYNVQAIDTLIGEIDLPDQLIELLRESKVAQQEIEKLRVQTLVEEEREKHVLAKETAQMQVKVARHHQEMKFAELERQENLKRVEAEQKLNRLARESEIEARRKQAEVDALSKRLMSQVDLEEMSKKTEIEAKLKRLLSQADMDVLAKTVEILGSEKYTEIEKSKILTEALNNLKVPLVPQTMNTFGTTPDGAINPLQANPLRMMVMELFHQLSEPNFTNLPSNSQLPELTRAQTESTKDLTAQPIEQIAKQGCPVVLLIDTSSSMSSAHINQLIEGVINFRKELMQDTVASHNLEIAIITFGDSAHIVQDFTTVENLLPPKLVASGKSAMGQGIELALNKLKTRKAAYKNNGIQERPAWIFLIAGSTPTDNWQNAAQQIRQAFENSKLNFFAMGIQGADMDTLNQIAPSNSPVMLDGSKFQELFHWLADSLKKVVTSDDSGAYLPPITEWAKVDGHYRQ